MLLAAAAGLAATAGCAEPVGLRQLAGGKNNRVFRLDLADGGALALKSYFADPRDPRDRLAAEWGFLTYVTARRVDAVPAPLACDPARHLGLYRFVPGRKLDAAEVTSGHIDAAADFVAGINAPPFEPERLAPGSESCFTMAVHLATIDRRIARLSMLDPEAPHVDAARAFVTMRLIPAWASIRAAIEDGARRAGLALDATLGPDRVCVSPSDFGFHNALVNDVGRLVFIDFEYAGRDDPAKLVCDFFCQPEIPVPRAMHDRFLDRVAAALSLGEADVTRCRLLLDAYRVKWTCIILNEFLPLGAVRRAFADPAERAARCAAQLAKAEQKLGETG